MIKTRRFLPNYDLLSKKNCDGAVAIEFAVIASVLFLVVIGFIELGLIFFTNSVLEGATSVASRTGRTGFTPGRPRTEYLINEIVRLSGNYLERDRLSIEMLSYDSFANVGRPEEFQDTNGNGRYDLGEPFTDTNNNRRWDLDRGIPGPGGSGDTVLYRVNYKWDLFTPLMRELIGTDTDGNGIGDGPIIISATATVRNEPF